MPEECEKQCLVVTYDLAIAKMDYQIQSEEKLKFDSIFIALGAVLAEFGGLHILNEYLVLAKESTKSFQTGKNYQRCKRMHEISALAVKKLQFGSFLETYGNAEDIRSLIIQELGTIKEEKCLDKHEWSQEIEELLAAYKSYTKETSDGKQGKTANFWINCVNMIHLYRPLITHWRSKFVHFKLTKD